MEFHNVPLKYLGQQAVASATEPSTHLAQPHGAGACQEAIDYLCRRKSRKPFRDGMPKMVFLDFSVTNGKISIHSKTKGGKVMEKKIEFPVSAIEGVGHKGKRFALNVSNPAQNRKHENIIYAFETQREGDDTVLLYNLLHPPLEHDAGTNTFTRMGTPTTFPVNYGSRNKMIGSVSTGANGIDTGYMHVGDDAMDDAWDPTAEPAANTRFGYNISTGTTDSTTTFQTARSSDGVLGSVYDAHDNTAHAARTHPSLVPSIASNVTVMPSRMSTNDGGATRPELLVAQTLEAQNALLHSQLRVSELERDKEILKREALELKSEMASLAADMATDLADIKNTMLNDATDMIASEMAIVKSALGVLALKVNTVMVAVVPPYHPSYHVPPATSTVGTGARDTIAALAGKRSSEDVHSVDSGLSARTGSHGSHGSAPPAQRSPGRGTPSTSSSAGGGVVEDSKLRQTMSLASSDSDQISSVSESGRAHTLPHHGSTGSDGVGGDTGSNGVQRSASLAAFWAEVTQEDSTLMVPVSSALAVGRTSAASYNVEYHDATSLHDSAHDTHHHGNTNNNIINTSTSSRMLNLVKRLSSLDSSKLASQKTTSESGHHSTRGTLHEARRGSGSSNVSSDVLAAKDNEISYHRCKAEQLALELATRAHDVDTLRTRVEQLTEQMLANEPGGEHKIRNGLMRRSVVLVSPFEGEAPPPHREPEHLPVATGVDGGVSMPPHTPDSRAHRGSQDPEATAMVHSWLQATHAHAPPDAVPDAHPEIHPGVESVDPEATATQSPRTMAAALAAELARHPGESRSGFHGKTSPGDRSDHTTSFASYTSSACKTPELGVMASPEVIMEVGVPVPAGASLGLCIAGGTDSPVSSGDSSIYVTNIVHGGSVHRDGRVLQGDKILAVDGVSLTGVAHSTALDALRRAGGGADDGRVVVLSVSRVPMEDFYEIVIDCSEDPQGLGIEVSPAEFEGKGIFISHIVPNGSAALSEHLLVGDRIVTVGGVPIIGKSIDEARELLAACANTEATLAIARVHESFLDDASSTGENTTALSQQTTIVEDVLEISFEKTEAPGLGITIVGGTDHPVQVGDSAVYVTGIVPGSAAELDGRLCVGDRIIEINEVNTVAVTHGEAIRALQLNDNGVKLIVSRLPTHEEDIIKIAFDVGPNGLGFSIYGGIDQHGDDDPGIVVLRIQENGSAAIDGRLQSGDLLLDVNGHSLVDATHDAASELLSQVAGHISLTVARLSEKKIAQEIFVDMKLEMPPDCAGLGFSIAGGVDEPIEEGDVSIYVTQIIEGGFTHRDGQLRFGDKLVQVNGTNLTATTHEEAIATIANARGTIFIRVARLPGEDEENEDILQVEFSASQQKLGMQIEGGSDDPVDGHDPAIYIANIATGGAAAADGRLRVGDKLLVCNGISLSGVTHGEAIRTLKNHLDDLKLTISRMCLHDGASMSSSVSPIHCS